MKNIKIILSLLTIIEVTFCFTNPSYSVYIHYTVHTLPTPFSVTSFFSPFFFQIKDQTTVQHMDRWHIPAASIVSLVACEQRGRIGREEVLLAVVASTPSSRRVPRHSGWWVRVRFTSLSLEEEGQDSGDIIEYLLRMVLMSLWRRTGVSFAILALTAD